MTAPRNPDLIIDAFLAEGITDLPDRVFDAVRGEIQGTRQRVVIGRVVEPSSRTLARLAIAAAVTIAIGIAGLNLRGVIDPGPASPAPTPTASPAGSPRVVGSELDAALAPGRWAFRHDLASPGVPGPTIVVTIPSEGWTRYGAFAADKNYGPSDAEAGPSFVVWRITNHYVDPCTDQTPAIPGPDSTIDGLLTALGSQRLIDAGPITDVIVDGYRGKFIELTSPMDLAECPGEFWPWVDKYIQAPGEVDRVYAIDVDGFRLTFFLRITPRSTPADVAELESILASIDIVP